MADQKMLRVTQVKSAIGRKYDQEQTLKSLGTNNAMNIVKATAEGLKNMQSPEQVAERRGVSVDYIWGRKGNKVEEAE